MARSAAQTSGPHWVHYPTARICMGTDDAQSPADECPSRLVTVGSMTVSAAPITVAQWGEFVEATGYETVAEAEGSSFGSCCSTRSLVAGLDWWTDGQTRPDRPVTHVCWLDAWEYCRWSRTRLPTEAEWVRVATVEPSLIGQLWLWCDDWYDATHHRDAHRVNPRGPDSGSHRVARGGSTRPTARAAVLPDVSASDLGFRVVQQRS